MNPVPPNTGMLLWGSFAYALVVLILIFPWRTPPGKARVRLCGRMGPAVWDPKQSWASTVTAIGAVLATVLSARPELPFKSVKPEIVAVIEHTTKASDEIASIRTEFLGLSIFFGALILIAPLFYIATRTKKEVDAKVGEEGEKEGQYQGYVWSFMLTSLITLWGAVGQLMALFLLFGMLKLSLATAFQWLLGLTLFPLIPLYAWRSIGMAIQTADIKAAKGQVRLQRRSLGLSERISEPPLPEWTIL
jgi:hypothetical protein